MPGRVRIPSVAERLPGRRPKTFGVEDSLLARRRLTLLLLLLVACHEQVFEPVRDGLVATVALDGDVRVVTRADILFVVDASVSMASKEPKIAAGLPALLDQLDALDPPVDYRLAVMTSSVEERFGPCLSADPNAPGECSADFGLTGFQCVQNACVRDFSHVAGQLVAANGNPLVLEKSQLPRAELEQKFTENVLVGTAGARHEQAFRAFTTGIDSGALDQFLRPDARLVLFIATDHDDCSDTRQDLLAYELKDGQLIDNCALQSASGSPLLDSVVEWVDRLRSLPVGSGKRDVAIGAAIGLADGTMTSGVCTDPVCASDCQGPQKAADCQQQCQGALEEARCVSECQAECVLFCGAQAPGTRITQAVQEMQGTLASICDSDYGPDFARLARVIGIPEALDLPSIPSDDRTVFFQITRGGRTIDCQLGIDFTIDSASMPLQLRIDQGKQCRLLPDDRWSVRYLTPRG